MDDIQRMIERYKRELMAMSKSSQSPEPPVDNKYSEGIGSIFPDGQETQSRRPLIVGYVADEDEVKGKEKIFGEIAENADIAEEAGEKTPEAPTVESKDYSAIDGMEDSIFVFPDSEDRENDDYMNEEPEGKSANNPAEEPTMPSTGDITAASGVQTPAAFEVHEMPDHTPMPTTDQYRRGDEPTAEGSRSVPAEFPEPVYDSCEDFLKNNSGSGTIRFNVYTASEALPVAGAKCLVTKMINEKEHIFYTLYTDISGRTPPSSLPAPSKELSQDSENKIQPFALYDAFISKEGYADVKLTDIPIFDGVSSIQQVQMIPVPEGNVTENITEVQNANR